MLATRAWAPLLLHANGVPIDRGVHARPKKAVDDGVSHPILAPLSTEPPPKPRYSIGAREMVEFVLRRGDLGGEYDFMPLDRSLAGIRGHRQWQNSRPEGYVKEVPLAFDIETEEFVFRVRGRIDGVLPSTAEGVLIEEIKTIVGHWDGESDPLDWAQAKCYGYIYSSQNGLSEIAVQLTYLELDSGKATEMRQRFAFGALESFFDEVSSVYIDWVRRRHEWKKVRDDSIRALLFPYDVFRAGQRDLAVAAYRTLANGGKLFVEAPTGIGKTISVLFPAIKAAGEGRLSRVFYLTARTVGRGIAEKAVADMRARGLQWRSLTITAREKTCVRDGRACDARTCPLAIGYYDRRLEAMRTALEQERITRPVLDAVAADHRVCPFALSMDLSFWVDAVICDYHYIFDPQGYLRCHFTQEDGDCAVLVDEAHNLVDRAREMYSADLDSGEIDQVRSSLKSSAACVRSLGRLVRAIRKYSSSKNPDSPAETEILPGEFDFRSPALMSNKAAPSQPREADANIRVCREAPEDLLPPIEAALKEAEAVLSQENLRDGRENLLSLYFRLHAFRQTLRDYDSHYATLAGAEPSSRVQLYCLDPSLQLEQALKKAKSAVFFSATLTPLDYYKRLLGGASEDRELRLASPFPVENLAVLVHQNVQTRLKARGGSLDEVAAAIDALVRERRGNYLVYFPSYEYLTSVRQKFEVLQPETATIAQRPGMTEPEREDLLAAFVAGAEKTLVGFAVLGGVFGEGIDLVGERLIGVVVVGVGLPYITAERNVIRDHFEEAIGEGFDYAYLFPGMNRVLQAIGRVIRSDSDRGVALLLDARFAEPRYSRLFPPWWRIQLVRNPAQIAAAAKAFWQPARPT